MGLFNCFKNMCSKNRKLASYYTDVHPAGLAFHVDGILGNLWEATNPKGKKEYFIMPHDECWNTMCRISNNHRPFRPDPNDFVLDDADLYVELSEIYYPAKDEKQVWVYVMKDDNEDNAETNELFRLIPDFGMKKSQLEEQWRSNGWYYTYPSIRDYVKSLAYDDDVNNFFGWLFNDYRFNNTPAWSLPSDYEMALEQFFNLFYDLDD